MHKALHITILNQNLTRLLLSEKILKVDDYRLLSLFRFLLKLLFGDSFFGSTMLLSQFNLNVNTLLQQMLRWPVISPGGGY